VAARTANTVEADHVADVGASLLFHGDSARARSFLSVRWPSTRSASARIG
jgi:hypothetical protein